jgi:hypothetical protein
MKGQSLRYLFQWLMYHVDTPRDFLSLALSCKWGAQLAREYAAMKKTQFACLCYERFPVLPNRRVHGWVPGFTEDSARYFLDGKCVWLMEDRMTAVVNDDSHMYIIGKFMIFASTDLVHVICSNNGATIQLHKCYLCHQMHFLGFFFGRWSFCFAYSCVTKTWTRITHPVRACRRSKIAREVIDYAKSLKK